MGVGCLPQWQVEPPKHTLRKWYGKKYSLWEVCNVRHWFSSPETMLRQTLKWLRRIGSDDSLHGLSVVCRAPKSRCQTVIWDGGASHWNTKENLLSMLLRRWTDLSSIWAVNFKNWAYFVATKRFMNTDGKNTWHITASWHIYKEVLIRKHVLERVLCCWAKKS